MAPTYQKSINTLKRAEDLIALSQRPAALDLLFSVIFSKRIKNTLITQLEPIMLKFVDLCVELKRSRSIKEGLHQFKNIVQQANAPSVEKVITYLLDVAEKRIDQAKAESEAKNAEGASKQEDPDQPELIMLNSVSLTSDISRQDQSTVSPWLKFMWDIYRTALDTLRSNNRFKPLYQSVATRAFKFCLEHNRKPEFGRLCDLLRQHVSHAAKSTRLTHHIINFKDQDTVQRYLEVRFFQLNSAIELQLWQEAFRSIEDIKGLILMCKDTPKASIMANFYKSLANILLIAGNYPFHTEVLIRYYNIMLSEGSFTPEEQSKLASKILISALSSIPQEKSGFKTNALNRFEDESARTRRLHNLFQIPHYPTREYLIKEVISMGLIEQACPDAKKLFDILEVYTQPMFMMCDVKGALDALIENSPDNKVYITPLCQVLTIRLMQHLSKMYSVVMFDNMFKMLSFMELRFEHENRTLSPHELWKIVIDACNKAGINVYIDHLNQCVNISIDIFVSKKASSASYSLQFSGSNVNKMHDGLTVLANRLEEANILVESVLGVNTGLHIVGGLVESLKASIPSYNEIEQEFEQIKYHQVLISERKAMRAEEIRKAERDESLRNEVRIAAISALQSQIRSRVVKPAAHTQPTYQSMAASVPSPAPRTSILSSQLPKMHAGSAEDLEIKKHFLDSLLAVPPPVDPNFKNKLKLMFKRADHLERAYRLEELPYLEEDLQKQKVRDEESRKEAYEARLTYSKMLYESNMAIKNRLKETEPFYSEFRKSIIEKVDRQRSLDVKAHDENFLRVKEERAKSLKEEMERRRLKLEAERIEAERKAEQERIEEEKRKEQERIEEEKRKEQQRLNEERRKEQEIIEENRRKDREYMAAEEKADRGSLDERRRELESAAPVDMKTGRDYSDFRRPPPVGSDVYARPRYEDMPPPLPSKLNARPKFRRDIPSNDAQYQPRPIDTVTNIRSSPNRFRDNAEQYPQQYRDGSGSPFSSLRDRSGAGPEMGAPHSSIPPPSADDAHYRQRSTRFSRDDLPPSSSGAAYGQSQFAGRQPQSYTFYKQGQRNAHFVDSPGRNRDFSSGADQVSNWRRGPKENSEHR